MNQYNLISQPFLSGISTGGQPVLVNLWDALVGANQIREIRHPLPTVEFGLYRLLIALAVDIFFLSAGTDRNTSSLRQLLRQESFDAKAVKAYFEKYADRFDLFSETHPFLQDPTAGGPDKPVANLLPVQPSGTNVTHFLHGHEDDFSLTPAEAAQLLTTVAPFMTAGGAGLSPSINGAPPIYVLLTGDATNGTLFETICRNICALHLPLATDEEDAPAWRRTRAIGGEQKKTGYVESLTWSPRRILLTPGERIRTMKFVAGDSVRFDWRDPNCAYRLDDKGATILRSREGKELWRDTGPLALLRESDKPGGYIRPRLLDQVRETGYRNKYVSLTVYGIRTDLKMKIFEWQREQLSVPLTLIEGSSEYRLAMDWMDQAETAATQLGYAVKAVYPRGGKGNKKAMEGSIAYAERGFWGALRHEFDSLLHQLAELEAKEFSRRDALSKTWKSEVTDATWRAFDTAVRGYDTDNHALERLTRARRQLRLALHRLFETEAERQARKVKQQAKVKDDKVAKDNVQEVLMYE